MTSVRIIPSEMEDRGGSQLRTSEEESKMGSKPNLQLTRNSSYELN